MGSAAQRPAQTVDRLRPPAAGIEVVWSSSSRRRILSLPESSPYETVAVFGVNGFVKTIRADRGSRVKIGELIASGAGTGRVKAEAQSKLQGAQAQLAAVRSKADATSSTYAGWKAASATPGVWRGTISWWRGG
jgi:multidrug efflux pump subunit AcrA (membrane-fusion protein)